MVSRSRFPRLEGRLQCFEACGEIAGLDGFEADASEVADEPGHIQLSQGMASGHSGRAMY